MLGRLVLLAVLAVTPATGKADLMDLNTATPAQLSTLPGMGQEYVRRVIANRPYTAKNQLATRGILPQAEYEKIADLVVAHRVKTANSHD